MKIKSVIVTSAMVAASCFYIAYSLITTENPTKLTTLLLNLNYLSKDAALDRSNDFIMTNLKELDGHIHSISVVDQHFYLAQSGFEHIFDKKTDTADFLQINYRIDADKFTNVTFFLRLEHPGTNQEKRIAWGGNDQFSSLLSASTGLPSLPPGKAPGNN
ncbi:hypothetical protein [Paenibacillus sp. sgz500958]|uniref:hypothetical protein n=1 Tax=Paenibacillus sp. sgz500958 TaxID=3242475 RepID=UPI0036D413F0